MRNIFCGMLFLCYSSVLIAHQYDDPITDPVQEYRAKELSRIIKCPVCKGQPIIDSNAELAVELRKIVREKIQEGYTNAEVLDYVVGRYGESVSLNPPIKSETFILWFGPLALMIFGAFVVSRTFRKREYTDHE